MASEVKPHRLEILCIYACPSCGQGKPMVALPSPRKVACAACNTVFMAAPLEEAVQAKLQKTIILCSGALASEPKPQTQSLCFDLVTPMDKFSFDRLLKLEDLDQAYAQDTGKADRLYKNHSYCFLGKLNEINVFESFASGSIVSLSGKGFPVFCTFSGDRELLRGLAKGDTLLVQGTCRGLTDTSDGKGCVFSNCMLLAQKGHGLAANAKPPKSAQAIEPKSEKNPYDIRILLKPAPEPTKAG